MSGHTTAARRLKQCAAKAPLKRSEAARCSVASKMIVQPVEWHGFGCCHTAQQGVILIGSGLNISGPISRACLASRTAGCTGVAVVGVRCWGEKEPNATDLRSGTHMLHSDDPREERLLRGRAFCDGMRPGGRRAVTVTINRSADLAALCLAGQLSMHHPVAAPLQDGSAPHGRPAGVAGVRRERRGDARAGHGGGARRDRPHRC